MASFYTDIDKPEVGQEVRFTNSSDDASKFEWDFGDGYISNEENPIHIYTGTGKVEVTLTAISKSGLSDKATLTLEIVIPTLLEIEVREWYNGYVVKDASVILYSSLADWDARKNVISEGFSDDGGIVVFSNLGQNVYYVDVWEQNHDNYSLRKEDAGFVRIPVIIPNKINRFVAWVDYVDQRKGEGRGSGAVLFKKSERKASERSQPAAYSGTDNWQEMYSRRAGKK